MKKNALKLNIVVNYLNELLEPGKYPERSFVNGLEVEGVPEINKIIGITSPNLALFQKANKYGSQMILAHHGLIRLDQLQISGAYRERLNYLLEHNISYISYHIPLDANPIFGNNIQLAKLLKIENPKPFGAYHGITLGYSGNLPTHIKNSEQLITYLKEKLGVTPVTVYWPKKVSSVNSAGIISGGGARAEYPEEASFADLNCYITGNIDEGMISLCEELGLVYVSLGHYNSEKWGVKALGEHLADKFRVEFKFIEDSNENW